MDVVNVYVATVICAITAIVGFVVGHKYGKGDPVHKETMRVLEQTRLKNHYNAGYNAGLKAASDQLGDA